METLYVVIDFSVSVYVAKIIIKLSTSLSYCAITLLQGL